ncbi:hypothetical protein BGZ73_006288 [Actinomortierella ambigua]|nr:hypothetical protein BGZ73_006288 [Actinomortierella ambigua]
MPAPSSLCTDVRRFSTLSAFISWTQSASPQDKKEAQSLVIAYSAGDTAQWNTARSTLTAYLREHPQIGYLELHLKDLHVNASSEEVASSDAFLRQLGNYGLGHLTFNLETLTQSQVSSLVTAIGRHGHCRPQTLWIQQGPLDVAVEFGPFATTGGNVGQPISVSNAEKCPDYLSVTFNQAPTYDDKRPQQPSQLDQVALGQWLHALAIDQARYKKVTCYESAGLAPATLMAFARGFAPNTLVSFQYTGRLFPSPDGFCRELVHIHNTSLEPKNCRISQ